MDKISRRSFIRKTVATGIGLSAFPMIFIPKARAQWAPKTIVHPNVDNLRVVGITDAKMIKPGASFYELDKFIVKEAVWDNLDKLACSLSDSKSSRSMAQYFYQTSRKILV